MTRTTPALSLGPKNSGDSYMRSRITLALASMVLFSSITMTGQTRSISGSMDKAVPPPLPTLPSASTDRPVLSEIQAYLKASGSTNWSGLDAEGTIRYGADETTTPYPATLILSRRGETRLDVTTPGGIRSLRISGFIGNVQDAHGVITSVPLRNCVAGIVAFSRLLSAGTDDTNVIEKDAGPITLDGQTLHKVSVQYPVSQRKADPRDEREHMVADLYFGPDNLLYKSASMVDSVPQSGAHYLEVVSYSDYRSMNGVQIPFRVRATVEGQPAWDLQITTASEFSSHIDFSF